MTTTVPDVGIDVSGRVINLDELQAELDAQNVSVPNGLILQGPSVTQPPSGPPQPLPPNPPCPDGTRLFTCDDAGTPIDLPSEAEPIVAAYTPGTPAGDPQLAALKALQIGTSSGRLRDAIVAWIEARVGG